MVATPLVLGLLLDLFDGVEPLIHGVDVQVLEPEVVSLNQIQVVKDMVQEILPKARSLEKRREYTYYNITGKIALLQQSKARYILKHRFESSILSFLYYYPAEYFGPFWCK